ncbi:MAG: leucine-rich repeat domain-containing protein [Bryobacteraceae bacterium]
MSLLATAVACIALAGADDRDPIKAVGGVATRDSAGRVTAVDLRSSWVTDSDLAYLAGLPHLARLDLSLTRITDRGMQQLKGAPAIVELNLYYAELVTDEGMAAVKNWKHLKRVNLRGTKITDTTLEHLSGIETLEAIDAGFAQVTDVGLDHLVSLANLKELTIGGNKLTDMGLESLRQLHGLTYLDLAGMQRTDSGLWSVSLTEFGVDVIAGLRELRELRLGGMAVSARSFEKLKTLAKLERLGLQGCRRVGDDAMAVLATYPALKVVDVKGTAVSEKGLALLRQAKPAMTVLSGPWDGPRMPGRGQ